MLLLAGDIGGTKTVLAIFSSESGPHTPLVEATFPSAAYPNLEAIGREFLGQAGMPAERGCFGVSGPVMRPPQAGGAGMAQITNLPWVIEEGNLSSALGLRSAHLLNDLEAIACGIPILSPDDLHTLNRGDPDPHGAIAVIAPGTGLGEAYLTWEGEETKGRYRAHPSEGGHADLAPHTSLQLDLVRYLLSRFGHASCERALSGMGLPNIYAFLKETGREEEPEWLAEKLTTVSDPTPIIAGAALDEANPCPICDTTLELFVTLLGAEAGNLALKVLASGGVYVAGGIPRHILPALKRGSFIEAFQDKGRMSGLLERMPVHVVLNRKVGLMGAAAHGLEMQ